MPLYAYQERVKNLLQQGQSVILQAPTGAGKTRAALAPFIESFFTASPDAFPRKCIYSVPMKVLANQFVAEYEAQAASYNRRFRELLRVNIQTGDRPQDSKFESDLIFTTIDQTLSSFLNIPYGLGKRQANLNAGAILSSYLVFDELHLFDPDTTLPTTLEMLKMLKGITPFIVMTATFSASMLTQLAQQLDAVVVPEDAEARQAMTQIGAQVGKDRRFYAVDEGLTAVSVLKHPVPRTLCICNTVQSAQRLYDELTQAVPDDGSVELRLLHSRYYKTDRDQKEDWIRAQFGIPQTDYTEKRLIQIATQVIEVGVDATCDVLHTELSPASSLLQRAGRCARRAHEVGKVFVYLPRDDEGQPYYVPYGIGARGRTLCEQTWHALQNGRFTDTPLSFTHEQQLINQVHQPIDEQILQELKQNRHQRREDMLNAMRVYDDGRSQIPHLIRDVDNRLVFIHPNPRQDEWLQKTPWVYDGFGLYPNMIRRAFVELQAEGLMWGVKAVDEDPESSSSRQVYQWYPLYDVGEIYQSPIIAVHPSIAHYDALRGFQFRHADDETTIAPRQQKQRRWERYTYERETYAEHIIGLYRAYQGGVHPHPPLQDEVAYVVKRLEENGRFPSGTLDTIFRLLFVCHDLAKLSQGWQTWAHQWQAQVGQFYDGADMSLPPTYMAAHTDFDPAHEAQRQAQRQMPPRPNHAGESAMAMLDILDHYCDNDALYYAAVTAVARHHTPTVTSHQAYTHHPAAHQAIQEALRTVGFDEQDAQHIPQEVSQEETLSNHLITLEHGLERHLYFLLVRVLRLADQRSQVKG